MPDSWYERFFDALTGCRRTHSRHLRYTAAFVDHVLDTLLGTPVNRLPLLANSDTNAAGQNFKEERTDARVRVVAGCCADRICCQDIGLPVGLHLYARDRIVERECLQRERPRIVVRVLEHERRDRRAHQSYFAAREAVMPRALKPLIRIVGL